MGTMAPEQRGGVGSKWEDAVDVVARQCTGGNGVAWGAYARTVCSDPLTIAMELTDYSVYYSQVSWTPSPPI